MNALEINTETQTATQAILFDLADGECRSAKQLYERSEVLENRQEANKVLWELRQRGYVESAPATGDIGDPTARLVWSITDSGRAYLAGTPSADEPATNDTTVPTETTPATLVIQTKQKPKAKPAATMTVQVAASHTCQCGGTCGHAPINASGAKYMRNITLIDGKADVYAVLVAFGVTCPARQHAVKKLLCAGVRGKGDEAQDLAEARDAVERAIQMQREG